MLEWAFIRFASAVTRNYRGLWHGAGTTIPNPPPDSGPPPLLPPDPRVDPPPSDPPIKLPPEPLPPQKPDPGYQERQRLLLARALRDGWAMMRTEPKGRVQ
jgi:hypothetical protein